MQAQFEGLCTYFVLPITPAVGRLQTMRRLRELKDTRVTFRCLGPM